MKVKYVVLLVILAIGAVCWLGYSQRAAFEACKNAGVQSDETCLRYSF
jgi:hypothetical protein